MTGTASDWLTKARDGLRTVELLEVFDEYPCVVAAFHCQQSVEKSLKSFLTARHAEFLYRHDLGYLLDLCKSIDPACAALEPHIVGLTPLCDGDALPRRPAPDPDARRCEAILSPGANRL